jgi:hypothetical protein
LVWFSLYYFTFEISDIKITISEEDPAKLSKAKRRNKIIGYISMGFLVVYLFHQMIEIMVSTQDDINITLNNRRIFVMKTIKVTLDMCIHFMFLHLLVFIMKMKNGNARREYS